MRALKLIFKTLIIIACLIGILYVVKIHFLKEKIDIIEMYVASDSKSAMLYDREVTKSKEVKYNENKEIIRGTKLSVYDKEYLDENSGKTYMRIIYEENEYYILNNNLVDEYDDIMIEKNMYVRTPVTVYKDSETPDILGFLPKGSELELLGFVDMVDGIPNMYKIKYNDDVGYVYNKYLLSTLEEASKNYDEENTYAIHKDRKYSYELYGGHADELDYYPYEKVSLKDNELIDEARTLYLNASVLGDIDSYINFAKESNINAFVVDIYDGYMAYQSDVVAAYSPSAYKSASRTKEDYKNVIDKIKENDIYVIGRIVAFNNSHFAKDNPDEAISRNGVATSWVSGFSRRAWEYNVKLAIEAVKEFGFNEIQFDYVRFPELSYSWSKNSSYNFKNNYNESKAQAIQNFLFYATDKIHEAGAYVSADVFGEAAYKYVTAYGQYWPAISNIVDVISAMPYPDHFNKYDFGIKVPVWTVPYQLMSAWSAYAKERQTEIPTPAKVRTWIQAYNATHEPYITYGATQVSDQIRALYEAGLDNGYITWNAGSSLAKYKTMASAFKKEYR